MLCWQSSMRNGLRESNEGGACHDCGEEDRGKKRRRRKEGGDCD